MPRKRQRFNKLMEQLRATGGSPPSTGRVGKFHDFLTGSSTITQTNKIDAEARQLYEVGLIPFALSATTNDASERYIGTISAYSLKGLNSRATTLDDADIGMSFIEGGEQRNVNYYPALIKAKFSTSSTSVQENKTSGITGEKYKYDYGRTFSFPFGRTTQVTDAESGNAETSIADVDELDVYRNAVAILRSGNDPVTKPLSISYEAELFRTASKGASYIASTVGNLPTFSVS